MGEIVSSAHICTYSQSGRGEVHNMLFEATHETPQEYNLEIVNTVEKFFLIFSECFTITTHAD